MFILDNLTMNDLGITRVRDVMCLEPSGMFSPLYIYIFNYISEYLLDPMERRETARRAIAQTK
jgi:hypothetical protein